MRSQSRANLSAVFLLIFTLSGSLGRADPPLKPCLEDVFRTLALNGILFNLQKDTYSATVVGGRGDYHFEAKLRFDGVVELDVRAVNIFGERFPTFRAREQFDLMMKHFGEERVSGIKGQWEYGTNLEKVNELTENNEMSVEEAALETWTGQQASRWGFDQVEVIEKTGAPGEYEAIEVLFSW